MRNPPRLKQKEDIKYKYHNFEDWDCNEVTRINEMKGIKVLGM